MRKRTWGLAAALLLLAAAAWAGVTWSTTEYSNPGTKESVAYVTGTVTAETTGATVGTTTLSGWVLSVVTKPLTTNIPLAAYDCQLLDDHGLDVMGGALADRVNTTATRAIPWTVGSTWQRDPRVDGTVSLSCSAMGTTKQATVVIRLRR